jgi:hypothetical protein
MAAGLPAKTSWAANDVLTSAGVNDLSSTVNLLGLSTVTATAAGTTVLTVASHRKQTFTGTTTQNVTFPVVSTLSLGDTFEINNSSTGVVTAQSSGLNTILAMAANTRAVFVCVLISGTTAASWSAATSIPPTLITAAGDLIVGTAPSTVGRLGIGTALQVLRTNAGATAPEWAAATGGGKVLQVVSAVTTTDTNMTSTAYADTTLTATITPTSATSKIMVIVSQAMRVSTTANGVLGVGIKLLRGAIEIISIVAPRAMSIQATADLTPNLAVEGYISLNALDAPATTAATTYKVQFALDSTAASRAARAQTANIPSSIILMEIGA